MDERRHDAVDSGEVVTHLARALSVRDKYVRDVHRVHRSHLFSGSGEMHQ